MENEKNEDKVIYIPRILSFVSDINCILCVCVFFFNSDIIYDSLGSVATFKVP